MAGCWLPSPLWHCLCLPPWHRATLVSVVFLVLLVLASSASWRAGCRPRSGTGRVCLLGIVSRWLLCLSGTGRGCLLGFVYRWWSFALVVYVSSAPLHADLRCSGTSRVCRLTLVALVSLRHWSWLPPRHRPTLAAFAVLALVVVALAASFYAVCYRLRGAGRVCLLSFVPRWLSSSLRHWSCLPSRHGRTLVALSALALVAVASRASSNAGGHRLSGTGRVCILGFVL